MKTLWRSIGFSHKEVDKMIDYGETHPLYRRHNVISLRIAEFRSVFPNANIARIIQVMPSALTENIHNNLVNHRYSLDRIFSNPNIGVKPTASKFPAVKGVFLLFFGFLVGECGFSKRFSLFSGYLAQIKMINQKR